MLTISPQFITDSKGEKISVIIPIKEYEALMEELEDMEDERLYEEGLADYEPTIPIEEAFRIIEARRNNNEI